MAWFTLLKSIHFWNRVLHDLILGYFQLMSAEVSLKISKKYTQIVSSEDCAKHRFKNEDTLVIILARIKLSIAFMKSRIGSISKEIGLISITHVILNMSHFVIYSFKILCSNFCAHFDAIIVVFIKVPCWGMAYQITTIFWFLDDTKKRRIFKSLGHLHTLKSLIRKKVPNCWLFTKKINKGSGWNFSFIT